MKNKTFRGGEDTMDRKILIVDDEKNIVDIIAFNLKKEGYTVITAADGEEGVQKAMEENPDLILLDIMMPKMDGYEVCKKIREKKNTPIIMLTARAEELDKVLGLELGADDYVTKPFGVRELMARVKANLRKSVVREETPEQAPAGKGNFGKLDINPDRYEVRKDGRIIDLTVREFELLKYLSGSLTPLMPMFDTADTGIAEYSGDIVQEDAATYDASYNTNEDVAANERDVYNYLTGTMGMNSAAASGVMASMYRESRFYVDITNDYGTAYGLCQWYGDRWTNLQNYCNNNGLDWHTLYGQMRFLEYELNSLSSLRSYMYGISNDADGAYHAGYEWCRVYELGGNTSDTTRCDSRGTLARDTFWPKYQNGSTGGYTGWRSENGRDYWYENGVKQGTTGRGKEIYDASSDAWYWLDAVDGGAKAVNKDVYQESDGGKWVRYDENGHMIKGENCQNGNWYYFEPVTGAMIHGPWTLPDGRKVYYDLTTGIMQYGNVSINGSLYYFDPVYGTMKSGALTNFWVTDGNGKSFWYESWVRQGWQPGSSNYRGKEIYDPASGAWYWLDNVQQGAKATSKEVYQDSNGGKWVRYDANGRMIKGWYTQDGKTWYYDLTTGAMYKGWHTIEGSTYHFDETTGVKG